MEIKYENRRSSSTHAILLEGPPEVSINEYHECLLHIKTKEDLDATDGFTIFNKTSDEVSIFSASVFLAY